MVRCLEGESDGTGGSDGEEASGSLAGRVLVALGGGRLAVLVLLSLATRGGGARGGGGSSVVGSGSGGSVGGRADSKSSGDRVTGAGDRGLGDGALRLDPETLSLGDLAVGLVTERQNHDVVVAGGEAGNKTSPGADTGRDASGNLLVAVKNRRVRVVDGEVGRDVDGSPGRGVVDLVDPCKTISELF